MNDDPKYIVFENGYGIEEIIVFSKFQTHSQIAAWLYVEPLSAGFIQFTERGPQCYGNSTSLKIASRSTDSELAAKTLNWS